MFKALKSYASEEELNQVAEQAVAELYIHIINNIRENLIRSGITEQWLEPTEPYSSEKIREMLNTYVVIPACIGQAEVCAMSRALIQAGFRPAYQEEDDG